MVVLLHWLLAAHASDVVQGANSTAMGSTGAADPYDNAAITLNPGMLGLVERYDFHGHARFGPRGGLQWGATALDGRTSKRFAAGFAYSGDRLTRELRQNELPGWREIPRPDSTEDETELEALTDRRRQDDFTLSIGVPLFGRRVAIGTGVLFSLFNHDRDGQGNTADLHAGIGLRPFKWLSAGFSVRNFVPIDSPQDRPLSYVGSLRLMARDREDVERFAVEANIVSTDDPFAASRLSWGLGAQAASGSLRFRAGVFRDGGAARADLAVGQQRTLLTTGLGLVSKRGGGFDYSLLIPVAGDDLRGNTLIHQISFRFSAPDDILEDDRP